MYGTCSRWALLAARVRGIATAIDIRLATKGRVEWTVPIDLVEWTRWVEEVARPLGLERPGDWVVGLPGDSGRRRFSLLLLDRGGTPRAFAKFTRNPLRPEVVNGMRLLEATPPETFWAPRLMAHGVVDGWAYYVNEPVPGGFHRPARLDPRRRRTIVEEIQELLTENDDAGGMTAVHGDFGPWNVRTFSGDPRVVVIDWEELDHGPTAADEVLHGLGVHFVRKSSPEAVAAVVRAELSHHDSESIRTAARFWLDRLERPEPAEVDPAVFRPDVAESTNDTRRALEILELSDT